MPVPHFPEKNAQACKAKYDSKCKLRSSNQTTVPTHNFLSPAWSQGSILNFFKKIKIDKQGSATKET